MISTVRLAWITYYDSIYRLKFIISNRQQFLQINDSKSCLLTVEFGVPQGSVLGQAIFNLYVADLQEKLQLHCYQNYLF